MGTRVLINGTWYDSTGASQTRSSGPGWLRHCAFHQKDLENFMGRKVTPYCAIDPVQIVPPFGFTTAQRQQILHALPCVHGNETEFIAALARCARTFLWLRNQYRVRWTRAEQNAASAEIGRLAGDLARRLSCLDMDVEWALSYSVALRVESLPELSLTTTALRTQR